MTNIDPTIPLLLKDAKNVRARIRREFRRLADTFGYEVFDADINTDPRQARYRELLIIKWEIEEQLRTLKWG